VGEATKESPMTMDDRSHTDTEHDMDRKDGMEMKEGTDGGMIHD
jgi:hypothetical protein